MTICKVLPLVFLLVGCATHSSQNGDGPVGSYPSDLSRAQVREEMAEYATPGPEHARLAKNVGTWDVSVQLLESKDKWVSGSGTSSFKLVLGGRYLLEELNLTVAGSPVHAVVMHGFDLLQKRWFSVWFDENSTWPTYLSGTEDDSGTITRSGRKFDTVTPQGRPISVTMSKEGDRLVSHVFDTIDGEPTEVMQVYRTRR